MEGSESSSNGPAPSRGRGRGKSRGGLGKYLRARGRGRGRGRGAVWSERLVLEGEQDAELDEEEQAELQAKYSRRQLGTNADRYAEPEPELNSDGEPIVEPEVDLSSFLARQKLVDDPPSPPLPEDDDDVDTSIQIHSTSAVPVNDKKGKIQEIEWDESLEKMRQEKAAADAARDLKQRFRSKAALEKARASTVAARGRASTKGNAKQYVQAPELPSDTPLPPKNEKENLEDFLDDLLG
ncbi:hypothetical protein EIP91_005898 [Steccherinum ochraceum]|uniref:Uncharacterized protein n=1 Tax=Steccherinum ochraceum TaxID=92696 RepID=A0A4R0REV2_9APHY|nr:hypothetical protein EIP91_005898 [Steccherinum ochraceum]